MKTCPLTLDSVLQSVQLLSSQMESVDLSLLDETALRSIRLLQVSLGPDPSHPGSGPRVHNPVLSPDRTASRLCVGQQSEPSPTRPLHVLDPLSLFDESF